MNLKKIIVKLIFRMDIKQIYFMRHGETIDNRNRIIQGQADSPLTLEGIISIRERAKRLKEIPFDAIYCSPLGRAKRSLEILLDGLNPVSETACHQQSHEFRNYSRSVFYSKEIMELDFGTLTKRAIDDVKDIIIEHKKEMSKPYEGGESGDMLKERVISFVNRLISRKDSSCILVITHFGVIEMILRHYINLPYEDIRLNKDEILLICFAEKDVKFSWIK